MSLAKLCDEIKTPLLDGALFFFSFKLGIHFKYHKGRIGCHYKTTTNAKYLINAYAPAEFSNLYQKLPKDFVPVDLRVSVMKMAHSFCHLG